MTEWMKTLTYLFVGHENSLTVQLFCVFFFLIDSPD